MPLDGKQFDDLLSGFIDGALSEAERAQVEEAARSDARIAERLKTMERQSSWVRQCGRDLIKNSADSSQRLPMAQRVLLESQKRAREMGLPLAHYIHPYASGEIEPSQPCDATQGTVSLPSSRRKFRTLAFGGLVAAAMLLVSLNLLQIGERSAPKPIAKSTDNSDATSEIVGNEQTNDAENFGSSLVGKSEGMSYALVVDAQVTSKARRDQVMEKILAGAGLPLVSPLVANTQILRALDDSRMIVRDPAADASLVSIQVLRGDVHELDLALRAVWQDVESFPNVALNLSIDSRATLMRAMLRSSEARFTPSQSFALPLVITAPSTARDRVDEPSADGTPQSGSASPFPADDGSVQYVSSSQRANGWLGAGEVSLSEPESIANILLVLHFVD